MSNKQLHTFNGMTYTNSEYVKSGLTDTEFAKQTSDLFSAAYSTAQVRSYRQTLGIPNNRPRSDTSAE